MHPAYRRLLREVTEITLLQSVQSLLAWDQETCMPSRAAPTRESQSALLAKNTHQRLVAPEMGELLETLREVDRHGQLDPEQAAHLREVRRAHHRGKRLPGELVEQLARARARGVQTWLRARRQRDFELFAPVLREMVSLQRQVANAYGYEESVYDPLLDEYEPGMTCRQMEVVFGEVKGKLIRWVASCEAVVEVKKSLEAVEIPSAPQQAALANWAARAIGFDFQRGRLDESVHPFTLGISSRDVRLTNRFSWADPVRVVLATLHEAGHGLYRQAIDPKYDGTLLGQPTSCGMDEAQARLWENMIGRSRAFWTFARRRMQKLLGGDNGLAVADEIHDRINGVRPSPVRIDADEVTYNLHIILRFEIERELLAGGIDVEELPSLWNRRMEEYLGVYPRDDAEGILQDIHWADGCFGYFPTYTLGNLYAAQIFAAACADLPHIEAQIERGCFAPLRRWLREKVYRHGRRFTATELMVRATGKPPSSESFLNYLKAKVSLKSGRRRSV